MPSDAIGTLEIKVVSAHAPSDKHFYRKEAYARVSLDEIDWRKTPVRAGTDGGSSVLLDGDVNLPLSDQPKAYVEVAVYDRENDKEEVIGKAKINLREERVVEKGEVDVDSELHHHLRPAGFVRVHIKFVPRPEDEHIKPNTLMKMAEQGSEANILHHHKKKHSISLKSIEVPKIPWGKDKDKAREEERA
ncbi:hypothetical protein HDV00_006909 [Rhizophlyctis rosea]|nr:hypothetical protein HDV00_006909 [Rhizophlyctis rosea]